MMETNQINLQWDRGMGRELARLLTEPGPARTAVGERSGLHALPMWSIRKNFKCVLGILADRNTSTGIKKMYAQRFLLRHELLRGRAQNIKPNQTNSEISSHQFYYISHNNCI